MAVGYIQQKLAVLHTSYCQPRKSISPQREINIDKETKQATTDDRCLFWSLQSEERKEKSGEHQIL